MRADFGSAQNIQHLHGFFARTELLKLAGVDSLVLVGRKRDRGKTRTSSEVVRDFCSLPIRAHRCRTVSSSIHWKFISYRFLPLVRRQSCPVFFLQMLQCFIWTVKAGSEITENGLLSGGEGRKQSMAALRWISSMYFFNSVPTFFLADVQNFRKIFSSSFDISSIGFENLVPPGLASHSVTLR